MLDKMARVMTAVTAIALVWCFAGLASASTRPGSLVHISQGSPSVAVTGCPHSWVTNLEASAPNDESWNTAWKDNDGTGGGCWQRSAMHCLAAFGVTFWAHSKWTRTEGVWGDNHCPSGDGVLAIGADVGHQAGSPYTYYQEAIKQAHLTATRTLVSPAKAVPSPSASPTDSLSTGDGSGQTGSLDPNETLDPNVPAPATFPDGVWELGTNLDQSTIPDAAFCMFVDGRYCQDSQGPDNPFLVETSAFSNLVAVHAGACNYCYTIHVNSTGRCQFGSSTDNVELSTTTCDQSQSREVVEAFSHIVNGVTRWSFYNTGRGNWYGTNGPHAGYRVLIESVHSGFYTGWCVQPASGSC